MHIGRGSTVVKRPGQLKSIAVTMLFQPPFWLIWRRHLFESTYFHCKFVPLYYKYFMYSHHIYLNNLDILLFVFGHGCSLTSTVMHICTAQSPCGKSKSHFGHDYIKG